MPQTFLRWHALALSSSVPICKALSAEGVGFEVLDADPCHEWTVIAELSDPFVVEYMTPHNPLLQVLTDE
jgi:hypothetical protein